jgi:hypothetical protein
MSSTFLLAKVKVKVSYEVVTFEGLMQVRPDVIKYSWNIRSDSLFAAVPSQYGVIKT